MRKLFLFLTAALVSTSMWAQSTIFSAVPTATSDVKKSKAGQYAVTASEATVTGGKMYMEHNDGSNGRTYFTKVSSQPAFCLDGSKAWFCVKLNNALAVGDTIRVTAYTNGAGSSNARGIWITTGETNVRPSSAPNCELKAQSATGKEFLTVEYVVKKGDNIVNLDSVSIWRATTNSTYFKDLVIRRPASCDAPATELSLSSDAAATVYLGDEITFHTNGGNGGTITLEGANSETITDSVWVATLGTHTFTARQARNGNFCPQEDGLAITVICREPETALSLSSNAVSTIYVDDEITFSTSGGNGGAAIISGANSETISENKWTATVGSHSFSASQEIYGSYCAQESNTLIYKVIERTPVSVVTVTVDETTVYSGDIVTYTATAENAVEYEWYIGEEKQESDSAKFIITAKKGSYSITCKARNDYNVDGEDNPTWTSSEPKALTVTNKSGELTKVTLTSKSEGTITGDFTATKDINAQDETSAYEEHTGYKLGANNQYVGIKDINHQLHATDTAIIYVTTASANLLLFSDKGKTKIGEMIGGVVKGENKIVLNSNANGIKSIYLYRISDEAAGGGKNMNPFVYSLSVKRPAKYDVSFAPGEGSGSMDAIEYLEGAAVTLPACTFIAPANKIFAAWTSTDVAIVAGAFTMPSKNVTVTATYTDATALEETNTNVKAVKRLENGMLVIEKNGVRYNAQGQIIR